MEIADTRYIWTFLILVPVVVLMILNYHIGKKTLRVLGGEWRFSSLFSVYFTKSFFIALCFVLAIISANLALMNIRWGDEVLREVSKGNDVVLILDISRSMLATDVTPSRLERAKYFIKSIIQTLNRTRFGLVIFKGDAVQILPITEDIYAFFSVLDMVTPEYVTIPGSNLERAIDVAFKSFSDRAPRSKTMVLVSDGESLTGNPSVAARKARQRGIPIYCIAVGTPEGAQVVLENGMLVKDEKGKTIISKLNKSLLDAVARLSKGKVIEISSTQEIDEKLLLSSFTKNTVDTDVVLQVKKKERYRLFLTLSIAFLSISLLVRALKWKDIL